MLTGYKLLEN